MLWQEIVMFVQSLHDIVIYFIVRVQLLCLTDEWSQQEMETFSRCLIETNKDFAVVAKQVAHCL